MVATTVWEREWRASGTVLSEDQVRKDLLLGAQTQRILKVVSKGGRMGFYGTLRGLPFSHANHHNTAP